MKPTQPKIRREVFRPSLPGILRVPDPTEIFSTWQWFLLDSISDNLVRYQHGKGEFFPSLAQKWSIAEDQVTLTLREGLMFDDGSRLQSEDVVASFNRVLTLKRSTHFDIWNHLGNLTAISDREISFQFRGNKESLFLFLSSPEASIWSKEDVTGKEFKPRRFSGFYRVSKTNHDGLSLEKNIHSPRLSQFLNSPDRVEVVGNLSRWKSLEAIKSGQIDAFIGDYIPFSSFTDSHPKLQFLKSIPLVFIYLLKMSDKAPVPFNGKIISSVWELQDTNGELRPAFSILPPGMEGALPKTEALEAIDKGSDGSTAQIKIGASSAYFSEEFLKQISATMKGSGMDSSFRMLDQKEFFDVIDDSKKATFDYLLLGYVASDKFPFAQLKLLTGPRNIEVPVPGDEVQTSEKLKKLNDLQKSLLTSQTIVPLFFVPSVTVYRADLDIGNQPTTEAELQFWRVNENL